MNNPLFFHKKIRLIFCNYFIFSTIIAPVIHNFQNISLGYLQNFNIRKRQVLTNYK